MGWQRWGYTAFFVKDTLTVNGQLLLSSKGFRGGTRSDVSGNTGEGVNGFFQNVQPYYNGEMVKISDLIADPSAYVDSDLLEPVQDRLVEALEGLHPVS